MSVKNMSSRLIAPVKVSYVILAGVSVTAILISVFVWSFVHKVTPVETLAGIMPVSTPRWTATVYGTGRCIYSILAKCM